MILMVTVFLLFNYIYVQSHPCGSSCCKPSRIAQAGVSSPWQASCQRCNCATIACKSPICARRVAMCAAVSAFTSLAWRVGFSCKRSRVVICCRELRAVFAQVAVELFAQAGEVGAVVTAVASGAARGGREQAAFFVIADLFGG